MLRKTVLSVVTEHQSIDRLIVRETEVRDRTEQVDVTLGQAAVQSQMHTKQIGARQLPTERKITGNPALQTPYCRQAEEEIATAMIETVMIETLIGPTVVAVRRLLAIMTGRGETERMRERSFTVDEVTPEEALMSCHMVTNDPAAEVDVGEPTVMLRAQEVRE